MWAQVDPEEAWGRATVISRAADGSVELITDSGARATLPAERALATNSAAQDAEPDLSRLVHLSEPCLLHTLSVRYDAAAIYTYTGAILLALNPWRELPLYGRDVQAEYHDQPFGARPPHLFAIADAAYRGVRGLAEDQTILVSGESGAGKTESSKRLLEYLVGVSDAARAGRGGNVAGKLLQRQLLQAHPLLETLGNAQTARNDNSSRFGKFVQARRAVCCPRCRADGA